MILHMPGAHVDGANRKRESKGYDKKAMATTRFLFKEAFFFVVILSEAGEARA